MLSNTSAAPDQKHLPDVRAPIAPIAIKALELDKAINAYKKLNQDKWVDRLGETLGSKVASPECDLTRKLNSIMPNRKLNDETLLNQQQLLGLTLVLYQAFTDNDKSELSAIAPLVDSLGRNRICVMEDLAYRLNIKTFEIFCRIPDSHIYGVRSLLTTAFGHHADFTPETGDLIVKHSDLVQGLSESIFSKYKKYEGDIKKIADDLLGTNIAAALFIFYVQYVMKNMDTMDKHSRGLSFIPLINQIICSVLTHPDKFKDPKTGYVMVMLGVVSPSLPKDLILENESVRLVTLRLLTYDESQLVREKGQEGRQQLAAKFAKDNTYHLSTIATLDLKATNTVTTAQSSGLKENSTFKSVPPANKDEAITKNDNKPTQNGPGK